MAAPAKRIRVLVVDDSILARKVIIDGLKAYPNLEVVGFAINALDAKRKVQELKPDVMTLDVQMPGMTGLDFLKQLLPQNPLPVVLVSSLNLGVFDALHAGAVEFVRKPDGTQSTEAFISSLAQTVMVASSAHVRQPGGTARTAASPAGALPAFGNSAKAGNIIIGLGASTGGTEATLEVMKRLPADIPGMVIVQHMPPGFTAMYADRLNRLCKMEVREAKDGDEIMPGLALLAPADVQCRVEKSPRGGYRLHCDRSERVSGHRPSVDAMLQSIAANVRCHKVGIIMTGMGADGARGMLEMRQKGAYTIGQNKESCVVYGMPKEAYDLGGVEIQASCEDIAGVLMRHLRSL